MPPASSRRRMLVKAYISGRAELRLFLWHHVERHRRHVAGRPVAWTVGEAVEAGEAGIGRVRERAVDAQVERAVPWTGDVVPHVRGVELDRVVVVLQDAR